MNAVEVHGLQVPEVDIDIVDLAEAKERLGLRGQFIDRIGQVLINEALEEKFRAEKERHEDEARQAGLERHHSVQNLQTASAKVAEANAVLCVMRAEQALIELEYLNRAIAARVSTSCE